MKDLRASQKPLFREKFFAEVEALGLTDEDLIKLLSVDKATLNKWRNEEAYPARGAQKLFFKKLAGVEEERYQRVVSRMQTLSTRRVLRMLRGCYQPEWLASVDPEQSRENTRTYKAAKAVLATREHIPNKEEAKRARQRAAKIAKGQGKSKNR